MSDSSIFNLKLRDFQGPLDLLDSLIRERKMDILDLDVAAIAEQYANFVNSQIDTISIDEASEYLEMSTYLLQLKSKKVIPSENIVGNDSSFEYERDKLIQRIIEYRKYKEVAQAMLQKRELRLAKFSKTSSDFEEFEPDTLIIESLPNQIDPKKLFNALNLAFERYRMHLYTQKKIIVQELSIAEVEEELWNFLVEDNIKKTTFSEYLSKIDVLKITQQYIVSTFLALLDLTKYQKIKLTQNLDNNELLIERIK